MSLAASRLPELELDLVESLESASKLAYGCRSLTAPLFPGRSVSGSLCSKATLNKECYAEHDDERPLTTAAILRHGSSVRGSATVRTLQPDGSVKVASFAEIGRQSARLANALRGCGITGDERVAAFMWNNQEHVEALLCGALDGRGTAHSQSTPRLQINARLRRQPRRGTGS